ncbi:site-specific DNA-methyltransferase [Spongiactinospora gelatinilytica]|uniref:Methyltransferase n=1 Tax=Spongiactinospora gelatinilytica TaxID=2666298 RepID=A0A2W2EJK1_9ACTN|nr:site-specific DNA-methyltransferase [Spongiactinospora gelatinilytica]PZG24522.1 site-specific DNA-methyltransferase [Spongiactinospora gelatinilytica]
MKPFWSDDQAVLFAGDARQILAEMADKSVDCVVTSPPYWGLRHYCDGEYGQEPTAQEYVSNLVRVFAEIRRVLADDGTCWLNLGDCYAANSDGWARGRDFNPHQPLRRPRARLCVPSKNMLGMPWRVAFALQGSGWILRNAIVWHKPNAMPQSVRDRLSNRYELIFLLVKQRTYWFDLDPVRQRYSGDRSPARRARSGANKPNSIATPWPPAGKYADTGDALAGNRYGSAMRPTGRQHAAAHPRGSNPGDVWSISTRPLPEAHFAAFPIDIPLRAIAAGCRPGGTVLDPFAGSGTTGLAARRLDRMFCGIDLNVAYCAMARDRIIAAARDLKGDGGG